MTHRRHTKEASDDSNGLWTLVDSSSMSDTALSRTININSNPSNTLSPLMIKSASLPLLSTTIVEPNDDTQSIEQLETLINELEKQLEIELKIKSGAEQLFRHYSLNKKHRNKKSTAETLGTLSKTTQRIDQITEELEKLRGHALSIGIPRKLSHIRALSCGSDDDESNDVAQPLPAAVDVIIGRISRIKEKIDIETVIKAGAEKMAKAVGSIPSEKSERDKSMNEVFKSLANSTSKISLLNSALSKYQLLLSGGFNDDVAAITPTPFTFTASNTTVASPRRSSILFGSASSLFGSREHLRGEPHSPQVFTPTHSSGSTSPTVPRKEPKVSLTGRLTVKIMEANGVFKSSTKPVDAYVVIKVDSVLRGKTKAKSRSTTPAWNETFVLKLDKAHEIEFEVFESSQLRGLVFFRLQECLPEWNLTDGVITAYFHIEPFGQLRLQLEFQREKINMTRRLSQKVRRGAIFRKKKATLNDFLAPTPSLFAKAPKPIPLQEKTPLRKAGPSLAQFITKNSGAKDPVVTAVPTEGEGHVGGGTLPSPSSTSASPSSSIGVLSASSSSPNISSNSKDSRKSMVSASSPSANYRLSLPTPAALGLTRKDLHPAAILENYHLLKTLGRGNFGKVMLVEEKKTEKLFAMKVLKKQNIVANDEMNSLRTEKLIFQAANKDRHPFLVNLHSCFQSPTRLFFIMDYIPGGDLMLHIQRNPFSLERAQFYAAEVLLALEYLHKNNIIYRDLKLDNILLGMDGHIRIADYGLCKVLADAETLTNTFCGTPEFMAPEILREQDYGRAVDWWAFGVLLYEMLLSESPFEGEDEEEIFKSILQDEILYPAELPAVASGLLKKLLVRDPQQRLGSSHRDAEDIKRHVFFKGIDWDKLLCLEIEPPYVPFLISDRDTCNFDSTFTSEKPILTPQDLTLSKVEQDEFNGFSYTAPWLSKQDIDANTSFLTSAGMSSASSANSRRDSAATLIPQARHSREQSYESVSSTNEMDSNSSTTSGKPEQGSAQARMSAIDDDDDDDDYYLSSEPEIDSD